MGTAFEPKATGPHNKWYNPYGGPTEDIARLVGAGVAAGLAAGAVAASEKRDNETMTVALSTAAGLVFIATAASVIKEWYVNNRDAAIEPLVHTADEEALKLELSTTDGISLKTKEKNILLTTGEAGDDSTIALGAGVGIKFGDAGIIAIDDKGKISLSSDADISIESQGNIDLIANKKVRSKGEAFDYNGVLKHKNFKVLS